MVHTPHLNPGAPRLPSELFINLRDVLRFTFHEESTDYTVHKELRMTIASCCLVSYHWYTLFTPLLYSNIYLEQDDCQIALFRRTLHLRPRLLKTIRYLDINCSVSMSAYMIIVTRLPNLKALVVRNLDMVLIHPKLPSLLGCLPKTSELCFHLKIGLHEPMKYVVQLLQSSRPRTITVFSECVTEKIVKKLMRCGSGQCDNFVNIIHRSRNYKHILHIKLQLLQTVDLGVTQERLHIFCMTFQSLPDKLRSECRNSHVEHVNLIPSQVSDYFELPKYVRCRSTIFNLLQTK